MAKKTKEAKPISMPVALIMAAAIFIFMGCFIVYLVNPTSGNDVSNSSTVDEGSFAEPTVDEPVQSQPAEVKDYMADADVGDAVIYGSYEQNGITDDGAEPIQWIVLSKNDNGIMLISRYCLDAVPYNNVREDVSWENCSLRNWLNNEFFNTAFTAEEQANILDMTETDTEEKSLVVTDKVGILNSAEAKLYYEFDSWRKASATEYALSRGARVENGNTWWWLRGGISDISNKASYVYFNGSIRDKGFTVDYNAVGIRPIVWVSADAEREEEISEEDSQ